MAPIASSEQKGITRLCNPQRVKNILQTNPRDQSELNPRQKEILVEARDLIHQGTYPDWYKPFLNPVTTIAGQTKNLADSPTSDLMDPHTKLKAGQKTVAGAPEVRDLIARAKKSSWHQVPLEERNRILNEALTELLYDEELVAKLMVAQSYTPKQDPLTEILEYRDVKRVEDVDIEGVLQDVAAGHTKLATNEPQAVFMVENFANMLGTRALRMGLLTGSGVVVVGEGMAAAQHYFLGHTFHELLQRHGAPSDVLSILVTDIPGKVIFNKESGFRTHFVGSLPVAKAIKRDIKGPFFGSAQGPNMMLIGNDQLELAAQVAVDCANLENAGQCTQLHTVGAPATSQDQIVSLLKDSAEGHDKWPVKHPLDWILEGAEPFQKVLSNYPVQHQNPEGAVWEKPMRALEDGSHATGIRRADSDKVRPDAIPENWRHAALTVFPADDAKGLVQGQKPIAAGLYCRDDWAVIIDEAFQDVTVFSVTHPRYASKEDGSLVPTYPVAARPGNGEHFREAGVSNEVPAWGNPGSLEFLEPSLDEAYVATLPEVDVSGDSFAHNVLSHEGLSPTARTLAARVLTLVEEFGAHGGADPIAVNGDFAKPEERTVVNGLARRSAVLRVGPDHEEADLIIRLISAAWYGLALTVSFDKDQAPKALAAMLSELAGSSALPSSVQIREEDEKVFLSGIKDDGTPVLTQQHPSETLDRVMRSNRAPLITRRAQEQLPMALLATLGAYPRHIKTQAASSLGAQDFVEDAMKLNSWTRFGR